MNCQTEKMGISKRKLVNKIKSIYTDQWNKTENPEIYSVFNKAVKTVQ